MSISSVIKSLQDIMRKDAGVDGDAQRLGQLSWLLFLKIFDAQEEALELEQDNYQYPIPQRYLWRSWAANAQGITGDSLLEFVNDDLFPALKNLTAPIDKNPRGYVVKQAFSDAYNYMKNGTLLRQVINKLNEIDFTSASERRLVIFTNRSLKICNLRAMLANSILHAPSLALWWIALIRNSANPLWTRPAVRAVFLPARSIM